MKTNLLRHSLGLCLTLAGLFVSPIPGRASDPDAHSQSNSGRQRQISEVDAVRIGIGKLRPGMTHDEVRRLLPLHRLACYLVAGTISNTIGEYRVDADHRLLLYSSRGNGGQTIVHFAELLRGDKTIAKFPAEK